jgi:hypothetical protein
VIEVIGPDPPDCGTEPGEFAQFVHFC